MAAAPLGRATARRHARFAAGSVVAASVASQALGRFAEEDAPANKTIGDVNMTLQVYAFFASRVRDPSQIRNLTVQKQRPCKKSAAHLGTPLMHNTFSSSQRVSVRITG